MEYTVMYQRNLGIQNAGFHRNLERCNAKYENVSEEFRNTERILSREFRGLIRNTVCVRVI
jgi:glutaredoxin-related protein